MEAVIIQFLVSSVQQYPWFAMVIFWLGMTRFAFKPIMSIVQYYVDQTVDKKDDEWLAKLKASKIYQGFVWFLDYSSSIKLPK